MAIIRFDLALRNQMLLEIEKRIDSVGIGEIEIRTGTQPATPETTATGTLLATLALPNPIIANESLTSAPSWSGGSATYTDTAHNVAVDDRIAVIGTTSALYDGEFTVDTVPDANTFTVVMADPGGAPTAVGSYRATSGGVLTIDPTIVDDSSADATDVAGWARFFAVNTDALGVFDCDVGETGGSETLLFNTVNFVSGKTVSITAFTVSIPASG